MELNLNFVKSLLAHDDEKSGQFNFRGVRKLFAESLYNYFNEAVFANKLPTVKIVWKKSLSVTAGYLDTVNSLVVLSSSVIISPSRLVETLAHEMCHVAVHYIDRRKKENHGKNWRRWTRKVTKFVPLLRITTTHDYKLQHKHVYVCSKCNYEKLLMKRMCAKKTRRICKCNGIYVKRK
ncbi:hypothetical protein [Trichoplusia ni ascovirus 2c]|uniref:hypothetical protein n=1 Tax=Trichoplusia ni ascovirus 2c TaxID=328615 RepID=UPI0000E441F6|nr:hypothetical protein TNAV2c_gp030 [Trichoplusia ni ascovirus 2c]ABF70547.1 hypothetical protein [Trichoplusia ni ascovirus 2c]